MNLINEIKTYAQKDMMKNNILASLTIAQAILESGWGGSYLAKNGKNLFGIKANKNWTGEVLYLPTTEYKNGKPQTEKAHFKKYKDWGESLQDHSNLLKTSRYKKIIGNANYKNVARDIYLAGYATDINYTRKLISIIEKNKLYQIDLCIETHGNIKFGEKSFRVKVLQSLLNMHGYLIAIDGIFGNNTLNAVKNFQKTKRLSIDGIVGNKTKEKF